MTEQSRRGRTCTEGDSYDLSTLTLLDWSPGDGTGTAGYNCWDYFDSDGVYRGPDQHGIEPVFSILEDE